MGFSRVLPGNHLLSYYSFIKNNGRFLSFGILFNFFSSIGQTYYISVFGGEFRREFGLSDGEFGLIFMVATVASAISLIWLGRFIDRMDLRLYSFLACLGCVLASYYTSLVNTVTSLCITFYLLRLMGQGLMSHIAVTSIGRYFNEGRGRAIAMITLGNTLGVGIFPIVGVNLIAWFGWRNSWAVLAIICAIILIPLSFWLLKDQKKRHNQYKKSQARKNRHANSFRQGYSVQSVLSELRFYFMMPALLAPSFLLTGFLFHQVRIVEAKNWTMTVFASGFSGLAVALFLTSLLVGYLVDKWRAINLLPLTLTPLAVGLFILNFFHAEFYGFVFLILMGISFGGTVTISGSIWPELYGTDNLGAIKSMSKSLMILASAISPWVFGVLFDFGFNLVEISYLSVGIILVTAISAKFSQIFQYQ